MSPSHALLPVDDGLAGLVEFIKESRVVEALKLLDNKFDRASCEELIAAAAAKGISLCGLTKEERLIATVKPIDQQGGLCPPWGEGQYDYLFHIADIKVSSARARTPRAHFRKPCLSGAQLALFTAFRVCAWRPCAWRLRACSYSSPSTRSAHTSS